MHKGEKKARRHISSLYFLHLAAKSATVAAYTTAPNHTGSGMQHHSATEYR